MQAEIIKSMGAGFEDTSLPKEVTHTLACVSRPRKSGKIKLICQQCGKEFPVYPSDIKNNRRFCSQRCGAIGRIPWNKGLHTKGTPHTEETKRKLSEIHKRIGAPWNIGRKYSKERCERISKANMGKPSWWKGKKHTKETKLKMSLACRTKRDNSVYAGKNHWNWQGGKSFEHYEIEFNKKLKEKIRKRDNYICQECFKHQDKLFTKNKNGNSVKEKLSIHHIDYDKKNNNPDNLISLCRNCHCKTNKRHRIYWINRYKQSRLKSANQEKNQGYQK